MVSILAAALNWNKGSGSQLVRVENREDLMERTRCPNCEKQMVSVVILSGRTVLQCISCDDPAVKWAESPLTAPEEPFVQERA